MSPKANNLNVSSNKSMDITTTEKSKMPELKIEKPEIVRPSGMIKDISPSQSTDEDNLTNRSKIEMTDKLASNLKPPSESHIKIIPSETKPDEGEKDEPEADDLTNDAERVTDSKFIDNISDDTDEKVDESTKENKDTEKPSDSDKVEEKIKSTEPETKHTDEQPAEKESIKEEPKEEYDDGGIVNEMAEQAAESKKQKQEEKEFEVRSKHVEELIEAKTYNVPIGQLSRKRNIRILIVLLVVLIVGGLVALNFAVDAGMVDIGVEPLTDVISN